MTDEDSAPKPGHYLPGGAGEDEAPPSGRVLAPPAPGPSRPQPLPLSSGDHLQQQVYGWKPPRSGRHAAPAPPPFAARRRLTRTMVVGVTASVLLIAAGGVALSSQLAKTFDGGVIDKPLTGPTLKPSAAPDQRPADRPTVTVTATPTPDALVVKQNKLYGTGRLAPARCAEPKHRPTSKAGVTKYYLQMLPCLNKAWAPTVREAGFEFRAPKLVVYTKTATSPCTGYTSGAFYCGSDETIYMPWEEELEDYRSHDKISVRMDMAMTMAHEYGHHVQHLTGILSASDSRERNARSQPLKLEERRRLEIQATCLSAVYLGADKRSFGLDGGRKYDGWLWLSRHSGDEYNPDKIRDHGSRKSIATWSIPAFDTADPKSCNTFAAPASRVS